MMALDPTDWQTRLESIPLKQLFLLREMARLRQRIGDEVVPPNTSRWPEIDIDNIYGFQPSATRLAFRKVIWEYIQQTNQRLLGREAEDPSGWTLEDGFDGIVAIWDHWQLALKHYTGGRSFGDPIRSPSFIKQYLWDDSSEEEAET
jgi:hypothetical protein